MYLISFQFETIGLTLQLLINSLWQDAMLRLFGTNVSRRVARTAQRRIASVAFSRGRTLAATLRPATMMTTPFVTPSAIAATLRAVTLMQQRSYNSQGRPLGQHGNDGDDETLLQKYTVDLTAQARRGKLDPVIGRHDEMTRAIEILSRRSKNNPLLSKLQ
jgi:ATP-dependent Clp protease ATP-binding subunit ClpA